MRYKKYLMMYPLGLVWYCRYVIYLFCEKVHPSIKNMIKELKCNKNTNMSLEHIATTKDTA